MRRNAEKSKGRVSGILGRCVGKDYFDYKCACRVASVILADIRSRERQTAMKRNKQIEMPSQELLEVEIKRVRYRKRYNSVLRSTIYTLIVVASLAVLVVTIWLPILKIYGSSMTPTLNEGDIVVSLKGSTIEQGDLVAFYIGNKILVKRVIAGPGQWVDIDESGNVSVDGKPLDEPYITEKSFGDANVDFPYQVPDNRYFCMGDHRATSVDSRHSEIGCIAEEQLVGKIVFRVWPLTYFGTVE